MSHTAYIYCDTMESGRRAMLLSDCRGASLRPILFECDCRAVKGT